MSKNQLTALLGEWEGHRIGTVGRFEPGEKGPTAQVWIELLPDPEPPTVCSGSGQVVTQVHETTQRWIRDLPILDAQTHLLVHRRRVLCPRCGPKLEELSWLGRYQRGTRRLAESVARLCKVLPVKHVAEHYGLNRKTVRRIDKAYLDETLGPPDLAGVEMIAMDEFALRKGHRYATVGIERNRKEVLWVGRGRGREDVQPFFELLGEAGRKRLKAVAMDMNGAYEQEVRAQCPNAEIVYDLFHVVAKYGRAVIDRVRVDEANRLRDDKQARKVIKGSRWLLLRNAENITKERDRVRLSELLAANRKLATVYVLKDDLKHLWDCWHSGYARKFWQQWYNRAIRSRIEPLRRFARRLKEYLPGILAHCRSTICAGLCRLRLLIRVSSPIQGR